MCDLISVVDSSEWFWLKRCLKNFQLMLDLLKASILVLHFSYLLYINFLPDGVICNISVCADDTPLYSMCDQVSDLWQQLELSCELKENLRPK